MLCVVNDDTGDIRMVDIETGSVVSQYACILDAGESITFSDWQSTFHSPTDSQENQILRGSLHEATNLLLIGTSLGKAIVL